MKFALMLSACVLFMAQASLVASMDQKQYYVSPSGNDSNDGSRSRPFKTLARARDAVRTYKNTYGMTEDIIVNIEQGIYELPSTLTFDSTDSGINGRKIIYRCNGSGEVIISGGTMVPDTIWRFIGNRMYVADISALRLDCLDIRQLYYDPCGEFQRGIRARLENKSTFNIHAVNPITYEASSLPAVAHPTEVEVVARWHGWQWTIKKVQSMTSNSITLNHRLINQYFIDSVYHPYVMYLENAPEYIDHPGEWYYDKTNRKVYLKTCGPIPEGVVIPRLDKIISGNGVRNLTFEGLTFSYGTWSYMFANDFDPFQASGYIDAETNQVRFVPGNIEFTASSNITFDRDKFIHLGATGLSILMNSTNDTVQNSYFEDISADGIRVGQHNLDGTIDNTNHITITGNVIYDVAKEYRGSVGVFLGLVNSVEVSNNRISDLPYTGISIGYRWDTLQTTLGNVTITNNSVSNVMKLLNDGAAIYNLGRHNSQSHITNNSIGHIPQNGYIRAGIYLDQGSNNVSVAGNWGDEFPLNDERNTDIFLNYNLNSEAQGNRFGDNIFGSNSFWIRKTRTDDQFRNPGFPSPYHLYSRTDGDMGVFFIDVNHDGRKDMVFNRKVSNGTIQRQTYLNKVDHWELAHENYFLPDSCFTAIDGIPDAGVRFVDVNGDGYEDLLQHLWKINNHHEIRSYENTGNGWRLMDANYNSPYHFAADYCGDLGARFVDVNHDGKKDIVYYRDMGNGTYQRGVYLNTGNGWSTGDSIYRPPVVMYKDGSGDQGVRFVDVDDDGYDELLQYLWKSSGQHLISAYKCDTASGWVSIPAFNPPYHFSAEGMGDLGARFVDVNWDGKKDIVYNRDLGNGTFQKGVYLNNGTGWTYSSDSRYIPPITLYKDGLGDQGVRFVDLNGDNHEDIIKGYWYDPTTRTISDFYLNKARMFYETVTPPPYFKTGSTASVDAHVIRETMPDRYALDQNYPNPFNPVTKISYSIPEMADVHIIVLDVLGREIRTLVHKAQMPGHYEIQFDGSGLASGVYYYRIQAGNFIQTKKMLLLK